MIKLDLIGRQFGEWTALKSEKGGILCRCSCGVERVVRTNSLTTGKSRSCGHPVYKIGNEVCGYVITEVNSAGNGVTYRARCKFCGEIVDRKIFLQDHFCQRQQKIDAALSDYYVEGTNTQNLKSALNGVTPKNNTSGVRGVYYDKSLNIYKAIIKFKGRNYYLGSGDIEYCTKLRKEAEQRIFGNFLDWYEQVKENKNDG